jgi:hypothetical protein
VPFDIFSAFRQVVELLMNVEGVHWTFDPNVTEVVVVILLPMKLKVNCKTLLEFTAAETELNVAFPV